MPVEIMHLITDEISLLKEPYKDLLYLALTCKSLKAVVLPRLYDKDAKDSLKLDHQQPLALQWASWFGVLETAKGSLEALERTGTDVESKINQSFQNDHLYTLRYKTARRTSPSGPAYGYLHWGSRSGLLHLACLRGNTAIATLLLGNGFKPNTPDEKKLPPLAYALNEDVAKLLISRGADVNVTHDTDETALCHLVSWGPMDDCDWSKELNKPKSKGALNALDTRHNHFSTIRYLVQQANADIYANTIKNVSPLLFAISKRYVEAVRLLLEAGASPNPINKETGQKRLLLADALKRNENHEIVRMLLEAGAEADFDTMPEGDLSQAQGEALPIMNLTTSLSNPLYAKAEIDIARLVCKKIRHFNKAIDGQTPLWYYVRKGRGDIGQVLIEHGACPKLANVEVREDLVPRLIAHE
ncbi:ankyrin repeat-containing domain protein [Fusarium redolens]|uniref:Ankyrin repeat-containing domain protein n=1 Tax=Fusarium redolens TaxID=48865 RepID=A0A9P9GPR7_FUSRE|nr:ankyrin repeat-containing domain protein [Fusarium redolens]KAH7243265.1 ankyrin repeat-containing domain protein [Fusarium redolens]